MTDGTILDRSGRDYRPATIRSYRQAADRYLIPTLGHLRLIEVQRRDVQRLVDKMHTTDKLGGSPIRNKLDPLRVLYRRAMQDDEITRNPTEKLRLPALSTKARRVVAPETAATLLEALPDTSRALWTILFYSGLRISEARAMRWTHVDFDNGVIQVQAGWDDVEGEQDTKTTAGVRTVPMTGQVRRTRTPQAGERPRRR
jgi:integrase